MPLWDMETIKSEIFEEFVGKRNAMGYQEVLKQKTVLMNAAKEKMGISE